MSPLGRGVDEIADLGKGDDIGQLGVDLAAAHAEDRAVHVDILAAGQLPVEACAHLQHGADAAIEVDLALGGRCDTAEELQERRLSRAVGADDAHALAPGDGQVDAVQCPEALADQAAVRPHAGIGILPAPQPRPAALQLPLQGAATDGTETVALLHTGDADRKLLFHRHLLTPCR